MNYKLLMRYKNLGDDDVITRHYELVKKFDYSWGGWWAKPNESLPIKGITFIEEEIKKNHKAILYLIDSDNDTIHKAEITEVYYDKNGGRIKTPHKESTPSYYSDSELLLWFKISSLQLNADPDCISKDSYADNNLFNVSEDIDYSIFDNVRVGTISASKAQRRSLVLLRDSQPDDKEYEFYKNRHSLFSKFFSPTNSNKILLLSDIHFSEEEKRFAFSDCSSRKRTINTLSGAISDAVGKQEFAACICAGDLTFKSSKEEYKKAESFFFNISNTYSIDKHNIVIVPGNHDIMFEKNDGTEVIDALPEAKELYGDVFSKLYGDCQDDFFCVGRRFLLQNKLPIEIIGLNSNILQQDEKFRGLGFVGPDQLELIANKMKWNDKSESNYTYRIMVLHHHLYPVDWSQEPKKDFTYSTCLDSGMILSFAAKYKIDLIVHGHRHQWNFIQTTGRTDEDLYTLNILGLGSAGSTDVGNAVGNNIGVLDFSEENWLNISILALSENGPARNSELFTRHIPIKNAK